MIPAFPPFPDCMFVTSRPGNYIYESATDDVTTCGVYFVAKPDERIELEITEFDVPCGESLVVV